MPNPVSGPLYRFLKVRKNRFFGQDKVKKSQDFGFRNLRMNPVFQLAEAFYKKSIIKYNLMNIYQCLCRIVLPVIKEIDCVINFPFFSGPYKMCYKMNGIFFLKIL